MNDLIEQFLVEGRDLVAGAEAALEMLAGTPDSAPALDALFRAVHTLKGSVGLFDMGPAEGLLHAAEDKLSACRKARSPVDTPLLGTLIAVIDLTDRWIDEMEARGRLGQDASGLAAKLLERLGAVPASAPAEEANDGGWIDTLDARLAALVSTTDVPLIAFRYTPDPECFFRGDDPLATVAAVPDLLDLAVCSMGGWPALADWDPFRCVSIVEGLSRAPLADVRHAFRLMPDQTMFASIAPARGETVQEASATVRVETARLDRLADEVGELVVATNALAHIVQHAATVDPVLAGMLRAVQADVERIGGRLHRAVTAARRVPLGPALRRLPRLVRDISESLGKPVRFDISGQGVEVDKAIGEQIFEPLLHLVRNALDHGIETPELRVAAGKPAEGLLRLTATVQGDELLLALADDGAGIDPATIRAVAVARGSIDRDAADALDDAAALRLILRPGFSTAEQVSELSGRGVGMDSVQAMAQRLGGRLDIDSRPGHGTTMALRLPLDAITTRLLVVRAGEERYGIRLDQVVETARVVAGDIKPIGTGEAVVLRDRTVPLFDLAALLGGAVKREGLARLVVTEAGGQPVAVRVDGFDQRIDALVRNAEGLLAGLPGVGGTTLMGDGRVLLVLDLPELVS